jgi:thioredoxin 1
MTIENLTDENFETQVSGSQLPVLVDFWAPWCQPCKQMAPALDSLAEAMSEKVRIVKINVDENPEAASQYGIRALPTLMVFKNGAPTATKFGLQSMSALKVWVDDVA